MVVDWIALGQQGALEEGPQEWIERVHSLEGGEEKDESASGEKPSSAGKIRR